jgi:D-alanyl-D-alanine endopeptidase (penicillin-binding protein 7)
MNKFILHILLVSFIGASIAQNINTKLQNNLKNTNTAKKIKKHSNKKARTTPKKHSIQKISNKKHKKFHSKHHKSNSITTKASYKAADYISKQTALPHQPKLYSYSSVVLNAKTGKILISKNPTVKLPIASLTKLMTAMVLLDSGVNMDDYITISTDDIDTIKNTFSRLKVGLQFRRRELLLLALMSSENRAAHALARTTFKGGINVFINKMNGRAKSLGMQNTQFYDPTGLTNKNQSTAKDLSIMVQEAYNYEQIRKDTTSKEANVMFGPKYIHRYINSDVLVRNGDKIQIELSKTGFINESGHCLALYSIIDGTPIVMVFLNSSGKDGRILDAMTTKNYVLKMKGA